MSVCYNCPEKPCNLPCPHHLHRDTCDRWQAEKATEAALKDRIKQSKTSLWDADSFIIEGKIAGDRKRRAIAGKYQVK